MSDDNRNDAIELAAEVVRLDAELRGELVRLDAEEARLRREIAAAEARTDARVEARTALVLQALPIVGRVDGYSDHNVRCFVLSTLGVQFDSTSEDATRGAYEYEMARGRQ